MPPVRARRGAASQKPKRPPAKPAPRLATIKLEGAKALMRDLGQPRRPRRWGLWLASAVMIAGAGAAGAAFIGGSLLDARERIEETADRAAAGIGLTVTQIDVAGVEGAREAEVRAIAMPERRLALTAANPQLVKARIERLDWVGRASVQRMWPSTIRINVERRTAVAVWRRPGAETVIDAAGAPVSGVAAADVPELPRVIGKNALADAQPVLAALEELPSLRRQVQALVSVGDRRLDLHLKSGLVVALPAENAASALAALMTLDARYDVLDRPLARIDLRDPDRAALLPKDVLAGGPGAPISAADGRGG